MLLLSLACTPPRASGPIPQDAYVWQRVWTPELIHAVEAHDFRRLMVLGAELSWTEQASEVFEVKPARLPRGSGLVLRAEAPPAGKDPLPELRSALLELHGRHPEVERMQVDMDMPTSRLPEYAVWVEALNGDLRPEVSVTALPTWIGQPGFEDLAGAADAVTLQVHWLDPNDPGHLLSRTVEEDLLRMASLDQPFQLALPCYGYPERALMADPAEIAPRIAAWTEDRPAALESIIWFRLPTAGEAGVWHPRTLEAVSEGRVPEARAELELQNEGEVWTIVLHNRGEADLPLPAFELEQPTLFADGLGSWTWSPPKQLLPDPHALPLAPDAQLPVAWIRSPEPPRVALHAAAADPAAESPR